MSIQAARSALKTVFEDVTPSGWAVTTDTDPDKHHKLVEIGHVERYAPLAYKFRQSIITVTLWVSEDNDINAVDELYALVDRIFETLNRAAGIEVAGEIEVFDAGPRYDGPTRFLACPIRIPLKTPRAAS